MSWRDTLYVWDGILTAAEKGEKKIPIKWEGTWVAMEGADARKVEAPKRGAFDEFVESDMRFEVEGTAEMMEAKDLEEGQTAPYMATLSNGARWDMGEGDDKKKHKDDEHELLLANLKWTGDLRDQRKNLVFAKGKNEHGSFVAAGWSRPGNRVTLARRYLEDGDIRAKWSLEELREAVLQEVYVAETNKLRIPPWQCGTLHSELMTKKRSREADEAEAGETKKVAKQ